LSTRQYYTERNTLFNSADMFLSSPVGANARRAVNMDSDAQSNLTSP
jgi:hypothetical protein